MILGTMEWGGRAVSIVVTFGDVMVLAGVFGAITLLSVFVALVIALLSSRVVRFSCCDGSWLV